MSDLRRTYEREAVAARIDRVRTAASAPLAAFRRADLNREWRKVSRFRRFIGASCATRGVRQASATRESTLRGPGPPGCRFSDEPPVWWLLVVRGAAQHDLVPARHAGPAPVATPPAGLAGSGRRPRVARGSTGDDVDLVADRPARLVGDLDRGLVGVVLGRGRALLGGPARRSGPV